MLVTRPDPRTPKAKNPTIFCQHHESNSVQTLLVTFLQLITSHKIVPTTFFWLGVFPKDRFPEPCTLHVTSEVFTKFYQHWSQRCLSIGRLRKSAIDGHVSNPCNNINFTAGAYTWPMFGNQMSCWLNRCFKLINAHRAFWVCENTSSDVWSPRCNYPGS